MNIIAFLIDLVRKFIILILSVIVILLLVLYFCFYDKLADPNIMLWIIIVPAFLINILVKK